VNFLRLFCFLFLSIALPASMAFAEDEAKAEEAAEEEEKLMPEQILGGTVYVPIKPTFIVNYGSGKRLKYLKADVSVRVETQIAADAVLHHLPFIRNNLVMLFASQTNESIDSQAGKEALRQEAAKVVGDLLKSEDGIDESIQVFFSSFILQG